MIYDFLISATSKVRPIFDSQKCELVPLLRSRRTEVSPNNNNNNNNNNNKIITTTTTTTNYNN